jgi:hypothetical protein
MLLVINGKLTGVTEDGGRPAKGDEMFADILAFFDRVPIEFVPQICTSICNRSRGREEEVRSGLP